MALISGGVAVPTFIRDWAEPSPSAFDVISLGVGYLLLGFALTLCSAAMICAVDDVLRGEPARIGVSYRRALRHWRQLLAWSLLNTTVLLLIRQLKRIPVAGEIMDGLFSAGWAVATYLALPAMMIDGLGVTEGIRRSSRMLRATFSRQVYGSLWIAAPVVLSVVIGFLAFMLGVESNSLGPAVAGGVVAALLLMCALLAGATISGIFRTVLYRDSSTAA
ncbi:hypothetical protein E6W39_20855 [Kitasatospora acidiphila]|uniref:Uncharacterized protein n=1 Tax=Kitasatospora acidiphila TaxID=2567942 RepID=A0A540W5C8_9ACTN|nr:DUF6159 family protein [Kitasatospora acidiphila]TQF04228.1 hypothetical protein E6W39_20855 [Kitasatospora acidiphila]